VFTLTQIPGADLRLTVFDQWNDQIVDGIATPVRVNQATVDMGEIAVHQWKTNLYTRTFFDKNGNGVSDSDESGLSLVYTNIRYRDGSFSNFNSTDLDGYAGFNEVFPLFNWYLVETDTTRYKNTGTHVVYDAGGPVDGSPACGTAGYPACGSSTIAANLARTYEDHPVPGNLHVPGAVYCNDADCTGQSITDGPNTGSTPNSTGRVDPPWVNTYGWQGFIGQNQFLEFGKAPFQPGENGGIHGHVVYASTRPFDDPALLLQLSWEPQVPGVTINLYQVGEAPDKSTSLKLVDTTVTTSWDEWAQGFRSDGNPNMNCPGQMDGTGDLFFFTLNNQPNWLDLYNNTGRTLPNSSQYKCFDGMHNWNQLQPAPYDGMYAFPSVNGRNPSTGVPSGTNCSICTTLTDGSYQLPAGKYVVEMIVPPGYELVKEEDKNILLGDTYVAPVTSQFAGFGNIFIMPDQAAVGAAYNPNNPLIPSTDEGVTPRHEGDTGSVETFWPCVGEMRVVPDFMSIYPQSGQNAPFAGAMRPLCDRKLVTLEDQMTVLAKFYVFTSTHVAAHYTGLITDDLTAEFDPFSPAFGEKFAPPNLPVSVRDWAGNEISRVYADQWGAYNGLTYSSYGVNPPDPSGYVPTMMVTCMNDAGTPGHPDPLYNPSYSQFCYESPFMPGQTQYLDTPVVPTSAFAGAGYNNPDCAYPNATPAIKSVVSNEVAGPWVSASGAGHTLTITGLGDQSVNNNGYSGPSATTAPYNQKTITRHYGFGGTQGTVTIGGQNAAVSSWSDSSITVTVPGSVPLCAVQQQAQYGAPVAQPERCGELVITAANGRQSTDTVTVTIGGKTPTVMVADQTIQSAIDAARPGDLIIVPPGVYNELVIMWKPVRLQGVGAASTIINASTHPSGVLDPWRARMVCLFGLALNGQPQSGSNPYNPDPQGTQCGGWSDFNGGENNPQVDRLPLEGILGWDATTNGNLAEQLQEPTLLGAYEGAGITVVAKGVRYPAGANFIFGNGPDNGAVATAGQFPVGTNLLTSNNADCITTTGGTGYSSNFQCNPSRIDGLSITNSSQGGGGIFAHAWAHNLEISNNRVYNNAGTLTGGITVGLGETPDALLSGNNGDPVGFDQQPWTCVNGAVNNGTQNATPPGFAVGTQLPFCYDRNVNVHNNAITINSSIGDQLFSATPAGAGGITISPGSDSYKLTQNWVCGNLSTGDGGGILQLGYSENGLIEHNSILFNQSTNPTIPTNGGGIMVLSTAPDGLAANGTECGSVTDVDCAPQLGDGTGPGLVINANLIQGNAADSGSGGGIRLQNVNGTEISRFPTQPTRWYGVKVTNNIIVDNVAGWDGAGVSLADSLKVDLINNTIISNDTTASSGTLFNTFRSGQASTPPPGPCTSGCGNDSPAQAAGVSAVKNSAFLQAAFGGSWTCPAGHSTGGFNPLIPSTVANGNCQQASIPILYNNLIWKNRAFHITVGGENPQFQQAIVTLTPTLNQSSTGQCVSSDNYWDIGVRGDTGPTNHASGITLQPVSSVISSGTYGSFHDSTSDPTVAKQYCNGSRIPPEFGGSGYQVPPGTNEGNVPTPIFNLTAGATVDEGNNWINISWGPLSLVNPVSGAALSDYSLTGGSPSIDYVTVANSATSYNAAPNLDFFNRSRKANGAVDVGAVEFVGGATLTVTPASLTFADQAVGTNSGNQVLTLTNSGGSTALGLNVVVTAPFNRNGGSCAGTLNAGASCTINVRFSPTAAGPATGTVTITSTNTATVANSPVGLSGNGIGPRLTVNPASLSFGSRIVGSGNSANQVLTLTNAGGSQQATGLSIVVSAQFNRNGGSCGTTLNAGASCTINVRYSPTAVGAASGTVTITAANASSVTNSPVSLSGTGIAPTVTLTPSPAPTFPNTLVGANSANTTFTLTSNGPIQNIAVAFTGPFNRNGGNCTTSITATGGGSCTIFVRFSPVSPGGLETGSVAVSVSSGTPATAVTVNNSPIALQGTGLTTVTVSVPSPALTTGAADRSVKTGTATVTNSGGGTASLTALPTVVRTAGTGTFAIVAPLSGTPCTASTVLGPGATCTVGVQYTPPATGAVTSTAHVNVTDTGATTSNQNSANFNGN